MASNFRPFYFSRYFWGNEVNISKFLSKENAVWRKKESSSSELFLGPKRELLNLDSVVSDKQVEEVVQLLLSLQFAFNFLTKKFVS